MLSVRATSLSATEEHLPSGVATCPPRASGSWAGSWCVVRAPSAGRSSRTLSTRAETQTGAWTGTGTRPGTSSSTGRSRQDVCTEYWKWFTKLSVPWSRHSTSCVPRGSRWWGCGVADYLLSFLVSAGGQLRQRHQLQQQSHRYEAGPGQWNTTEYIYYLLPSFYLNFPLCPGGVMKEPFHWFNKFKKVCAIWNLQFSSCHVISIATSWW